MNNQHSPSWNELLSGKNCHLCGPQPDANEYKIKIAPLRISTLYLFRDQRFRGYCLLIFDRYHATSLVRLSLDEYRAFAEDLRQAGAALEAALRPDHMNYELLGNSGPHLHWHVIPRYTNDPRWARPVWEEWPRNEFNLHRVTLEDREYADLVSLIRSHL